LIVSAISPTLAGGLVMNAQPTVTPTVIAMAKQEHVEHVQPKEGPAQSIHRQYQDL
jgi:hypothetical protein